MTEFLKLLSIYYLCDSTAVVRPLSPEEFMGCQRTYETVKSYFSGLGDTKGETRADRNRAAYLGFKSWEDANPELVAQLRQDARARLGI